MSSKSSKRKYKNKLKRRTKPYNPNPNRIENIHRTYRRQITTHKLSARNDKKYKLVFAPQNLSFINNTEEVLAFFSKANIHFSKRRQVEFDLSNIEFLTPETIALFLAKIKDKNFTRGINWKGHGPNNPYLFKILKDSGFYNFVSSSVTVPNDSSNILINKITKNKVENNIARELCIKAVKNTFNNEKKFRPIYEILIECMANTNNHASLEGEEKYNWWIFEYFDTLTNITSFTFLDLGVGIFNSIPVRNFFRDIGVKLGLTSNVDLVDKLLAGEISSKTGKQERGKGMPLIYNRSQNSHIRKFHIISNDVHANLESGVYKKLNYNFAGTMLYWELHPLINQ